MKTPFFSIVIPVYNRSEILKQRLEYLLEQEFKDFEVIIVDDGSSDDPAGKLSMLLEKNSNIKIISQKNSERGAARNNGIKNSTGEYVVLFDSDDFMHKDHLVKLHSGILKHGFPDFIATKFDFRHENGKHESSEIQNYPSGIYDYKLFLNGNPFACNICFKRKLPDLILFEEDRNYSIKEDWMFLISNLKKHKLLLLDDTTISMYDHENRSMKSDNKIIISRTLQAVEWIKKHLSLTKPELKKLYAHQNYFCGIHSYLDGNKSASVKYSFNALVKGGLKKRYVALLVKSILGRKIILKVK